MGLLRLDPLHQTFGRPGLYGVELAEHARRRQLSRILLVHENLLMLLKPDRLRLWARHLG